MDFFAYFAFIIIFLPLHNGFIDLCEEGSRPTLWLCRPYRDEMHFLGQNDGKNAVLGAVFNVNLPNLPYKIPYNYGWKFLQYIDY